ncbi:GTPase domain-containing protein [Oceanobacillus halophilus]|uniref:GTP-binding protein n=1 Tax=Oceanobacillus halophilus TaxID=930130 RepID=A0A494ZR52_9BACI|nr:GTPase domain-containing protein [Oceanobacillus halophilus]RKQ28129.1 GTP-binding protein [Oceanobacillus halophilus]
MTSEEQFIHKSYYKTFIEGTRNVEPIKALGEMFMAEQQKEVNDLSYIRFAQGEVYYLNSDYESAIFKWENISNELKPWAQKNIADSYFQLDLLAIAEDYYKGVETESAILKIEVLLQLFSLYIRRENLDLASDIIQKAVDTNPDYPNVTNIARDFFEENGDFVNAVDLAFHESIRTESLTWFGILQGYVEQGHTVELVPSSFRDLLTTLYHINQSRFERLVLALWESYRHTEQYFTWLKEINQLLIDLGLSRVTIWEDLSNCYQKTYMELINGNYLLKDLTLLMPRHLSNWLKLSTPSDNVVSASAVMAWNDLFPTSLEVDVVGEAESILNDSVQQLVKMEEVLEVFESIKKWAQNNKVSLGKRFEWMVQSLLDKDDFHLLVTGPASSGKSEFVNTILNEDLVDQSASTTVVFKDADEAEIQVMTDDEVRNITDMEDFIQSTKLTQTLIHCKTPVDFLQENRLAVIDTPGFTNQRNSRKDVFRYLHLADALLFVLNADTLPTFKELDMAVKMRERAPEIPIHFLLNECSGGRHTETAMEKVNKITSWIHTYFPNAKVLTFSAFDDKSRQLKELSSFLELLRDGYDMEEERKAKVLHYAKSSTQLLLEKRLELENSLEEQILWNKEMVDKFEGALHQLSDLEEENAVVIKQSYSEIIDELRQNLTIKIPEMLRNCSELIKEDSDIEKIHITINEEMNRRMKKYIEEKALPNFLRSVQEWLSTSDRKFHESQEYLQEMSDSFNQLYGVEKLALNCDFKVLDDWRRDMKRMTRGSIQLNNVQIFKRTASSQYLLKGAGKLFGTFGKNKGLLQEKYKQFIESKDYSKIVESITEQFLQQFEYFGNSLERDINMFFTGPVEVLNQTLEETHEKIRDNQTALDDKRANPEYYQDPLTLFEVKVRQYQWMRTAGKREPEYR